MKSFFEKYYWAVWYLIGLSALSILWIGGLVNSGKLIPRNNSDIPDWIIIPLYWLMPFILAIPVGFFLWAMFGLARVFLLFVVDGFREKDLGSIIIGIIMLIALISYVLSRYVVVQ